MIPSKEVVEARCAPELLTIAETAEVLGLSRRTVEKLIAGGKLRSAIAPGTVRARRISRAMIKEYIEEFDTQHPPKLRVKPRKP